MAESKLTRLASRAFALAEMELSVLSQLHADVRATLARMADADRSLNQRLSEAYGFAVFPSVGKATAVLGAAFGKGEVFRRDELVGYAAVAQLTIGLQLGGQTFSEVVLFRDKPAMQRFQAGRVAFTANASAVLLKAGKAASVDYEKGVAVLVQSDGGMMLEAAVGGQKFFFRPAVLGRGERARPNKPTATNPKRRATRPSKAAPRTTPMRRKTTSKPRREA